jgi:Protein of unknown function (DUF2510)
MPTSTQPGWYDDPEDSKAQRYWDGQGWTPRRQLKPISRATPPPPSGLPAQPAPPPPPPGQPPSPHQQGPGPLPGGGPPKKSRTPIFIAAGIGVVAVLAVAGMCGHTNTSSPGDQHSKSYQTGYQFAYANYRVERTQWAIELSSVHKYCANTAQTEAPVQGLNPQEWTQGCEDAFQKMGFGQTRTTTRTTRPSPTEDCSKRENMFHGDCF